ncbi:transposase, IS4 family protein [Shewanella sp. HN-41]|nr:transposase, IS4 family protein [Shewanella sp. HN-41]
MGFRQSCSRCPKRYDVLLLIAMLAEIVLWCIGLAAQHLGWQRYF